MLLFSGGKRTVHPPFLPILPIDTADGHGIPEYFGGTFSAAAIPNVP
jgi:hypothetical protein